MTDKNRGHARRIAEQLAMCDNKDDDKTEGSE